MTNGQEVSKIVLMNFLIEWNYHTFKLLPGPDLPIALDGHTESTVPLGNGQAILGGSSNHVSQKKIYLLNCFSRNCIISTLNQELSSERSLFVAIPIPDIISGCVTGGIQYSYLYQIV